MYSNSAVIADWLQWTRAQNILFWFTVIHSLNMYFTTINFYGNLFIWNYHLGIVLTSWISFVVSNCEFVTFPFGILG